jgi:hypothetical protein
VLVARRIGAALDHAHAKGFVHRDVKPSNILLSDDRVWLADFGIVVSAKAAGGYTTGAIGSADYMSPEQARTSEIDGRSDLYSLGCVLFECLNGHPPYPRDELVSTLVAHSLDPVPATGEAQLDAFFEKALAKEPEGRFSTGAELSSALELVLGDAPAPGPPRSQRLSHRGVIVGVVTASVLAASVFFVFLVLLPSRRSAPVTASTSAAVASSIPANSAPTSSAPTTTAAATTSPTREASPTVGLVGPVTVRDPKGARYPLLAGYRIDQIGRGAVNSSATVEQLTTIGRNGTRVILVGYDQRQETSAELYARVTAGLRCPDGGLSDLLFGGFPALRCTLKTTDGSGQEQLNYYVNSNGGSWVVVLTVQLSSQDRDRFVSGFRLG